LFLVTTSLDLKISYHAKMNKFTIIIPIYNEVESIFNLISEIDNEFKKERPEIIIVNDGSTDRFEEEYKNHNLKYKVVKHKKNLGKCKAMESGIKKATNEIVCIIDGDGQNPPSQAKKIIKFWHQIPKKNSFSLVCGNRVNRQDKLIKRISSRFANKIRMFILNDECKDTACALKVFAKSDYLQIPYFKNMHRFLPALFKIKKGSIYNVPVIDRKRVAGISKFNFHNRFWVGIIDLINVWGLINIKKGEK